MSVQRMSLSSRIKVCYSHAKEIDRMLNLQQLANGRTMPQIHLGVYLTSGKETVNAVKWALEVSRTSVGEQWTSLSGVTGRLSRVSITTFLAVQFSSLIHMQLRLSSDVSQ